MGLAFGVASGIMCPSSSSTPTPEGLHDSARNSGPGQRVLRTTGATNKQQAAEGRAGEGCHPAHHESDGRPSSARAPLITLVGPALAQSSPTSSPAQRFGPGIQIHRPSYVRLLRRASSQEEAVRLAREIQKGVPTAQR